MTLEPGRYLITTQKGRQDRNFVQEVMHLCHPELLVDEQTLETAVEEGLVFGVFDRVTQVGFARVVSDHIQTAWLSEFHIHPDSRGIGLGRWLIECILAHPDLQSPIRLLAAGSEKDAFLQKFGWADDDEFPILTRTS